MSAPDYVERDEALLACYPMVSRIAHRAAATYGLPVGLEANDLVSSGIIGLAEAWERYDPSRGVTLETYARPRIRGAMVDTIRASDWVSRSARRRARNTGTPTAVLVSLDGGRGNGDHGANSSFSERIVDESSPIPGAELLARERLQELLIALEQLPEREKMIVKLHYAHEVQITEIARKLGVTESRVSQLHGRALRLLREADESGDPPSGPRGANDLSPRELDVLGLMSRGMSNIKIGDELLIALNTVRNHIRRINRKLGTHSKLGAVAAARRCDVIGPD